MAKCQVGKTSWRYISTTAELNIYCLNLIAGTTLFKNQTIQKQKSACIEIVIISWLIRFIKNDNEIHSMMFTTPENVHQQHLPWKTMLAHTYSIRFSWKYWHHVALSINSLGAWFQLNPILPASLGKQAGLKIYSLPVYRLNIIRITIHLLCVV